MSGSMLDLDLLSRSTRPMPRPTGFPCARIDGLLSKDAFQALHDEFPGEHLFERHAGLARRFGQRPHDRSYLELDGSIYHPDESSPQGAVALDSLPDPWRRFLLDIRASGYLDRTARVLGSRNYRVRFAWHIASAGHDVSPHRDAREKIGTHLFYFNREWIDSWGGQFTCLSGKKTWAMNPERSDFANAAAFLPAGNTSILFRNTPNAWHAVSRLTCPADMKRRVFNIVYYRRWSGLARFLDRAEGWMRAPAAALANRRLAKTSGLVA
jgi:hypothetical protein